MAVAVFVGGLFGGSFLNVLVDRIFRDENFIVGRSYCESCRHLLTWQDLIPLFSFIFLFGRCRHCKNRIPLWLPIVELSTALVFILVVYLSWGLPWWVILLRLTIAFLLLVVFFADLKYRLVYEIIVYWLLGAIAIYQFAVVGFSGLINPLLSALVTGLFFYLLYWLSKKRGLGFGDVQIGFLMGFLLAWPRVVFALYLAFLTGASVGIILMIMGRAKMKTAIAFGPFLVLATFVSWFWGEELIRLVTNHLF